MPALMLNTECKYGPACTCDDQSRVLFTLVQFPLCVYVSVCVRMCALTYSYTYTCVSCINEPQGITVWDEKNGQFSVDIWPSVHHDSHQKTRIPLFLPLVLRPYRFIFIPSIFILPGLIPARAYILSAFSLRVTFSCWKRDFVPRSPSPPFSSSSFNSTRTNRACLTISEGLRFILSLISFLSHLSCVRSFFFLPPILSFSFSLLLLSSSHIFFFFVLLSELRNPTKCGNC